MLGLCCVSDVFLVNNAEAAKASCRNAIEINRTVSEIEISKLFLQNQVILDHWTMDASDGLIGFISYKWYKEDIFQVHPWNLQPILSPNNCIIKAKFKRHEQLIIGENQVGCIGSLSQTLTDGSTFLAG